jgi:3',5'-cyclic AMP phosphodiesterase CpdA
MRLIHITDPHLSSLEFCRFSRLRGKRRSGFLSWRRKRRHEHRPEILEHLTRRLLEDRPDQVLLTGDLVHIGLEREISEVTDWLRRVGPPDRVCLVPGNHDLYAGDSLAHLRRYWSDYLPPFDRFAGPHDGYPYCRDRGPVRLIGVNSSVPTPVFSARGRIGEAQAGALPRLLDPARFNVLLIHHPPFPGMTSRRKALGDDRRLARTLSGLPVDLVLHGHVHRNRRHAFGDARVFSTSSASSRRDASYRVFDVSGGDGSWVVKMQLRTLDSADDPSFEIADREEWRVERPVINQPVT